MRRVSTAWIVVVQIKSDSFRMCRVIVNAHNEALLMIGPIQGTIQEWHKTPVYETMFLVPVVFTVSSRNATSSSEVPRGFSTTQGIPVRKRWLPLLQYFRWYNCDAAIELSMAKHFIGGTVGILNPYLLQKFCAAAQLYIARCRQLDLIRVRCHITRKRDRVSGFRMLSAADKSKSNHDLLLEAIAKLCSFA